MFEHFDWMGTGADEVWSMKLDGSDKRLVTGCRCRRSERVTRWPQLSFKGAAVPLFVQNMDGTGLVQVSPSVSVAYKHDWAPDGRRLVFSDIADPGPTDPVNIATVRPDGSDMRYITHLVPPPRRLRRRYSPDGRWIVFRLVMDGVSTVYRMRPDGSHWHAIFSSPRLVARNLDSGSRGSALSGDVLVDSERLAHMVQGPTHP